MGVRVLSAPLLSSPLSWAVVSCPCLPRGDQAGSQQDSLLGCGGTSRVWPGWMDPGGLRDVSAPKVPEALVPGQLSDAAPHAHAMKTRKPPEGLRLAPPVSALP